MTVSWKLSQNSRSSWRMKLTDLSGFVLFVLQVRQAGEIKINAKTGGNANRGNFCDVIIPPPGL